MTTAFSLQGHVALVTGASRGIGRATAIELARAGASIGLVARDTAALEHVAAEVRAVGVLACVCPTDITDAMQTDAALSRCIDTLGPVDVLVNNAGVGSFKRVEELSDQEWAWVHEVNLNAAFRLTRSIAPSMQARGWGRIVNVASISGQTGGARGSVVYASTKGALIAFTKALARDLGPFGVTANAVTPGQIDTRMGTQFTPEEYEMLVRQIPVARLGTPGEVAHAIRFLASPEASYITGATLDVNGGILRR